MRIDPTRPMEELIGDNYGIVRMRLSNAHCMLPRHDLLRIARPCNMRKYPVALRRGWAKCALEAIAEFRGTYVAVMTGRL